MIPYSKIVRYPGNQVLFDGIEMSLLATLCGRPLHLHAEGLRGTGKTTILRAARHMFPPILRVAGCRYNCHPARPHCPEHRHLPSAEIAALGTEWVPVPFLEISHSAKLGTVVGSIDLGRLTSPRQPEAALLPGTIPQAHRGIIFVDEINRLAETSPELTDVLLGVMGTRPGRVQIEETGLPVVSLPVNACVWAASNPDEDPGPLEDIRRQLADRFDLVVNMGRPAAAEAVRSVLELADSYFGAVSGSGADDKNLFAGAVRNQEVDLEANRSHWQRLVQWVPQVRVPDSLRATIASLYVDFGLESLRAVEAWQLGARMRAALAGNKEVQLSDFVALAPLVLRHRVDMSTLSDILARLDQPGKPGENESEGKRVQVPAAAPAKPGEGSLGQLLSKAKEKLNSLMGGAVEGTMRSSRSSAAGGAAGGGGSLAASDPTRLPMASPPAPACPLVDLPPALWVREE